MVVGLYALKICALLHDIGKLECWARMRRPVEHVVFTYSTLEPVMGGELAEIAMRHHGEPGYEGYTPARDEEWIIAIAFLAYSPRGLFIGRCRRACDLSLQAASPSMPRSTGAPARTSSRLVPFSPRPPS